MNKGVKNVSQVWEGWQGARGAWEQRDTVTGITYESEVAGK